MSGPENFRQRVLAGEWLGGAFVNLGSSLTAEIAGRSGFDWLVIDHEHGPGSDETLLHQLQAVASTPAVPIVRIANNETVRFKRALDLGAAGVMVPYVNTVEEARAAVAAVRFPPHGIRGVAKSTRAAFFGQDFDSYYGHAHERLITMAQIETPEAVEQAAAIAAVDGVDVLFVGPVDLTTHYGVPGKFDDPRFVAARKAVVAAARKAGKAAGILTLLPEQVALVRAEGYTMVTLGSDGGTVTSGLRQCAGVLRGK
jgi:4-hydroxy-2-oxoheptanedioate aldolase